MSGALLFYTVAAFGLAYILGHAQISLGIRTRLFDLCWPTKWLVELVECPACFGTHLGFWFGVLAPAAWTIAIIPVPLPLNWLTAGVWLGLYTAGAGFLLGRATGLINLKEK